MGYSKSTKTSITALRSNHKKFYEVLKRRALELGKKSHVTWLLNHLGFDTIHTIDVYGKIVEDFKKIYTPEKIEKAINGGESLPTTIELRKISKYPSIYYNIKATKSPSLPSLRSLLDSLYPQYPNLSFYVTGI